MMKKATGTAPSMLRVTFTGVAISCGWAVLCAALIAMLLDREAIKMESVGYWAMAAHFSAALIGTMIARRRAGHMARPAIGAVGVGYFLCIVLANVLFFGGSFQGVGTTLILVLLASAGPMLTEGRGHAGSGRKRYKIPG